MNYILLKVNRGNHEELAKYPTAIFVADKTQAEAIVRRINEGQVTPDYYVAKKMDYGYWEGYYAVVDAGPVTNQYGEVSP